MIRKPAFSECGFSNILLMNKFCISLYGCLLILLSSCNETIPKTENQEINVVNFIKTDTKLKLPLLPNQFRAPLFCQSYWRNDSLLVMLHDPSNKTLIEYFSLTGEVVHKIPVDHYKVTNDMVFRYVNRDSIFLCYNSSHRPNYFHDSTVKRINYNGDLLSAPSFKGAPVSLVDSKNTLDPDKEAYIFNLYWGLIYHDKKLLMNMDAMNYGVGDTLYHTIKFPVGGHLDLEKNNFSVHSVHFPGKPGDYYPTDFSIPHVCVGHNGNLVYGFQNSPNLYEYDLNNDDLVTHKLKSSLIDTIKPMQLEKIEVFYERPESDPLQGSFKAIIYDDVNYQYLHFANLPFVENASNKNYRNPIRYVLVTDTNFNRIAEGIVPKDVQIGHDMKDKEGFFVWNKIAMKQNPSVFSFDHYQLQIAPGSVHGLKKEIEKMRDQSPTKRSGGIRSYIENNYKFHDQALVLFTPLEHSCPSCSNFLIRYFKENRSNFNNPKLFLVIADSDGSMVNHHLKTHGIERNAKNLFLDEHGLYMEYIDHDYGQGRLFIIEKGKISSEIIMDPANLDKLPSIVEEFL